jgi:hypothetical protein
VLSMRASRSQVLPLLLLLVCLFGCRGVDAFRVASVLAITTLRVAALAAEEHRAEARDPADAALVQRHAEEDSAMTTLAREPSRCTEVRVEVVPPPPGAWVTPRAVECDGIVLIQDQELHWRRYEGPVETEIAP